MVEDKILKESEVLAEFSSLQDKEALEEFLESAGPSAEEFNSPVWGLEFKGWAVSDLAYSSEEPFAKSPQRDTALSLIYYFTRFVLKDRAANGSDAGTDQRLDDTLDELALEKDTDELFEAKTLAEKGWRPL